MVYLWVKTFHLLFAIAWMSAVFYLPRILVNIAEAGNETAVRARLYLMGRRLYRFGHILFGLAFLLGLTLWQGWRVFPQALGLVAVLFVYFIWAGRSLKRSEAGGALPSARALRLLNELPVLLLLGVLYLVLAKPF
jgi:putative membrane protein